MFYRNITLCNAAKDFVCDHCVGEIESKCIKYIKQKMLPAEVTESVRACLANLQPYINPDYELIEQMESALRTGNRRLLDDILDVSFAVRDARTNQAFLARTTIPAESIPRLVQEAASSLGNIDSDDLGLIEDALASDLHIEIPPNIDVSKYLSCLEPYRNELAALVDELIVEINGSPRGLITTLSGRLADLNDELKKVSKSKSYLLYRATVAFMASNKTIIASGLLATALGMTGNMFGCGVSIMGGVSAQLAKRFGKLKIPPEVEALIDHAKHTARPHINKLVAKYLSLDFHAVQLWDIQEKLRGVLNKDSTPTKRPSKREAHPDR